MGFRDLGLGQVHVLVPVLLKVILVVAKGLHGCGEVLGSAHDLVLVLVLLDREGNLHLDLALNALPLFEEGGNVLRRTTVGAIFHQVWNGFATGVALVELKAGLGEVEATMRALVFVAFQFAVA